VRRLIVAAALIGAIAVVLLVTGTFRSGGGGTYEVRAVFDNAGFAVPGEQVRIAGAPVGTISSLAVTHSNLAAVTLAITNRAFTPWHANATCTIRPQSLIAERYVDCSPGTASAAALARIRRGGGAGSYLLPVTQTSSPIDPDTVQNISQEPVRQALSVILDQLGTGLAARGSDLAAVIRRADPALAQTQRVFELLDAQDHTLAQLAGDSKTVLAPLAAARGSLAQFVTGANQTAVASATQSAALAREIKALPGFLSALRPLMRDLGQLADQGTPLMTSLGASAGGLDREFTELTPFARSAKTALIDLGTAARKSQADLIGTEPLARSLGSLGTQAVPTGQLLAKLTGSLQSSGAIDQLMSLLFYGTGATNGFDADGHYLRTDLQVGSCTAFARTPVTGCDSTFGTLTHYLLGR
jgi:phospholipid/cholesterol/gamma-HCH transport system substrate-binding protein